MKSYKYNNYLDYWAEQVKANILKFNRSWAEESNIKYICKNILDNEPKRGLCHGVRSGKEVKWFKKYLKSKVIGTDISPTALFIPYVIMHDFSKKRIDFINKFEFIYSNSLDHAMDIMCTLDIWIDQLRTDGLLIIEWSEAHNISTRIDPSAFTLDNIKEILKDIMICKGTHQLKRKNGKTIYLMVWQK